jgi:Prp8 binding protein
MAAEVGDKRKLETVRNPHTGAVSGFKAKKQKTALIAQTKADKIHEVIVASATQRTSQLDAPTMLLTGHQGHIYSCKFNPTGSMIASSSHEKSVFLWNVYGECENHTVMRGHQGSVVELEWSRDGDRLFTASSDMLGAMFDVELGERIKRFRGHSSFVNSITSTRRGPLLVATGSDDCTAKLWDPRMKRETATLTTDYQVLSVAFSDDGSQLFTGGIENTIKCWDIRKGAVSYALAGHRNTVTGLSISPDGNFLLSNAMDHTLRVWDVRAYCSGARQTGVYQGASHDFQQHLLRCSWSPDGEMIAAGSSDAFVNIWDVQSKRTLYKLPGHKGSVSEVNFHPTEPVIVSCGADRQIFLGEI